MLSLKKVYRALIPVVAAAALAGCLSQPKLGNYEGSIVQVGKKTEVPGDKFERIAVSGVLKKTNANNYHMEFVGTNMTIDLTVDIFSRTAVLTGKNTPINSIVLSAVKVDGKVDETDVGKVCYASKTPFLVRLCGDNRSFYLEEYSKSNQPLMSIKMEYGNDDSSNIVLEKPQTLTLQQAIDRTLKMDFGTRIEAQTVFQARWTAIQNFLNVLPHLSGGAIVGATPGLPTPLTPISMLQNAGSLAPFLFPSNWIAAGQSVQLSLAEQETLYAIRGDAGVQTETLIYSTDHDVQELKQLGQDIVQAYSIRPLVADLEAKNLIPAGTALHYDSEIYGMGDMAGDLTESIRLQQQALNQAMGFKNPEAVPDPIVVPDTTEAEIFPLAPLSLIDLRKFALDRSIELRQIDNVIAAAKTGLLNDAFTWFDPSADLNHSLGFGLGAQFVIDRSNVKSLAIQREQVAAILLQRLDTAIAQYNHAIVDYVGSVRGVKLQETRMQQLILNMNSGQAVSADEITTCPEDLRAWQVHLLDAAVEFRTARANIQRVLLQGAYSDLDGAFGSLHR